VQSLLGNPPAGFRLPRFLGSACALVRGRDCLAPGPQQVAARDRKCRPCHCREHRTEQLVRGILDDDDHEQARDPGKAGVNGGAPVLLGGDGEDEQHDHGDQHVRVVRDRDRSYRRADRRREDGDRRVVPEEDERRAYRDDGDLDGAEALAAGTRSDDRRWRAKGGQHRVEGLGPQPGGCGPLAEPARRLRRHVYLMRPDGAGSRRPRRATRPPRPPGSRSSARVRQGSRVT
jgi:hypothetical protein